VRITKSPRSVIQLNPSSGGMLSRLGNFMSSNKKSNNLNNSLTNGGGNSQVCAMTNIGEYLICTVKNSGLL
jgi:hypothetical protein